MLGSATVSSSFHFELKNEDYTNKHCGYSELRRQECPNFRKAKTSRNMRFSDSLSTFRSKELAHLNCFATSLNPNTLYAIARKRIKEEIIDGVIIMSVYYECI